jgi:hypothetical protein
VRRGPLPRRTFLRGAAGTLIGLPWLEAMTARPARGASPGLTPAPRFVVFYTPNGHPLSAFRAPAGAVNPLATPILQPLTAHRDRLLVMEGIGYPSAERLGHECIGSLLTGARPGAGVSLDQEMVRALGPTRLGSLELGVSIPAAPAGRVHLSFAGSNRPRPAINDPRLVFDQIFPGDGNTAAVQQLAARRRSILDGVKANLDRTLTVVGSGDRLALQQHLESVRELEKNLDRVVPADCRRPDRPPAMELTDHKNSPVLAGLQNQLLSMAFACDATRVATLMLAEAGAERYFSFLGVSTSPNSSWVGVSHRTDAAGVMQQTAISKWCAERLSDLVGRLQFIREGEGTALDRTLILWMTECNPDHTTLDVPMALVAGNSFPVRTGQVLNFPARTSHNDLLLALLGLMGARQTSFGNPTFCTGPLSLA